MPAQAGIQKHLIFLGSRPGLQPAGAGLTRGNDESGGSDLVQAKLPQQSVWRNVLSGGRDDRARYGGACRPKRQRIHHLNCQRIFQPVFVAPRRNGMDIVTINDRKVVKCLHCGGNGICLHADLLWVTTRLRNGSYDAASGYWTLSCPKCGQGHPYNRDVGFFSDSSAPPKREMKAPVCGVCGGKGHAVVG